MKQKTFIAADLGASNGRTILGRFDGAKLTLEEMNRFENQYVRVGDAYYWDVLHLYSSILGGLRKAAKANEGQLNGIGIDTWGVDFGLIDRQGRVIGNPRAYRDPRGLRGMQSFLGKFGERTLFDLTGIANLEFNTVYQLYDMVNDGDVQLDAADKLLLMPDLLAYMFCGKATCEFTNATTTQMLENGAWSSNILDMIGIESKLLPNIQMSGEKKADIYPFLQEQMGLKAKVPVYCVGSHDTASAVASVPVSSDSYAFLSSGTWSLIGIESEKPLINDTAYNNNFSNEGTVEGTYCPLRNIMGLWIIQNCKREWDAVKKIGWDEIVNAAKQAPAFASLVDVNAHVFFDGGNMVRKIQQYCTQTNQPIPRTQGEIARTVYESLAMGYKDAFGGLEQLKDGRIDVLHIVGGGANNKLLNQMAASALNRPVVAGPTEATAIGNLMVQVKASGEVKDIVEMRHVIHNSFDVETYEPQDAEQWAEQYDRYQRIKRTYEENKR